MVPRKILAIILLFLIAILFIIFYKDHIVFTNDTSYDVSASPGEIHARQILYAIPVSFIDRIKKLEGSIENVTTSFMNNSLKTFKQINTDHVTFKQILQQPTTDIDEFWMDPDSATNNEIFQRIYTPLTDHRTCLVSSHKCAERYELLILVTSHISHFERRQVIRQTWGTDVRSDQSRWKTYFLIGQSKNIKLVQKLKDEISTHNDIVIGRINEDFYNLTYKLQMGFEWAATYCQFDFLLKTDDDVFINMARLFQYLRSENVTKTQLYTGNAWYKAIVSRRGRYSVNFREFKNDIYPRYCSGGAFVLSFDVVKGMIDIFPKMPYLKIDDVYIGIAALKLGVDVIHNDDFYVDDDPKTMNKCIYNEKHIMYHPVKQTACMIKLFTECIKKPP